MHNYPKLTKQSWKRSVCAGSSLSLVVCFFFEGGGRGCFGFCFNTIVT